MIADGRTLVPAASITGLRNPAAPAAEPEAGDVSQYEGAMAESTDQRIQKILRNKAKRPRGMPRSASPTLAEVEDKPV